MKAAGAKAPRKIPFLPGGASSSSSKSKYSGGNPYTPRPTPAWQKGIAGFMSKDEASCSKDPDCERFVEGDENSTSLLQEDAIPQASEEVDPNSSTSEEVDPALSTSEKVDPTSEKIDPTSSPEKEDKTLSEKVDPTSSNGASFVSNGVISDDDD